MFRFFFYKSAYKKVFIEENCVDIYGTYAYVIYIYLIYIILWPFNVKYQFNPICLIFVFYFYLLLIIIIGLEEVNGILFLKNFLITISNLLIKDCYETLLYYCRVIETKFFESMLCLYTYQDSRSRKLTYLDLGKFPNTSSRNWGSEKKIFRWHQNVSAFIIYRKNKVNSMI